MSNINLEIKQNVATLVFDLKDEKVNKLSFEILKEFDEKLNQIKEDSSIKALVIDSAKKDIFIAGADIKEIEKLKDEKEVYEALMEVHEIFNRLENLQIPTIAYINGACMGGGLELALACKYRIITTNPKTKIAFPEVKLGIFPGFAGTIRAPKIIGLINALDLILSGKTIDAKKAYKINLADTIFDDAQKEFMLEDFVKKAIYGTFEKKVSFNLLNYAPFNEFIFRKAYKNLEAKVNQDFKAPYIALEVIKATINKELEDSIKIEAKEFSKLAVTKESKNMIKLFFLFEKLNKNYEKTSNPISNAVVLGNGVMGKGIIYLFSKYLKDVRIKLRDLSQAHEILKDVAKIYDYSIKSRSMTKNQVDFKLNKISYTDKFVGFRNFDFIIEAIIEDEKTKKETYKELEKIINENTIIATNTSSISIEKLGSEIKNKENFLGVHFFNPVNLMPLVEIIPTKHTSKETINKVCEILISCGKTPIVVKDCAGFIVNRILLPYLNEAAFILEEGSKIERIDSIIKDFGMPMGPFTLADTVGIDIGYKVATILNEAYGSRMPISSIIEKMYEKNLLGVKTKAGFYEYESKDKYSNVHVTSMLENNSRIFEEKEILERCLYIMINEASRCLEENIVTDASIIDFAMITGTGFPAHKGGLLSYANEIGLKNILESLRKFEKEYGERFKPSNLLVKLVEEYEDFETGESLWKH
ncbi:MAG: 3-hydroxyacyl-CoA dehydrogenase NAD-binding domain-containing protein [Arcobacter sp.]|jgi:3-hydroxyacyl-CoA dehydrogenase/enoyl-CoA hydratase/3-hydroxybutyryl-CoA epimerase|uniref:3-hydroxyacyl-CoA dehydrogenase NAD-binding domain-containing protein n=1 Tax=Arcobacter sp. TaxID=1872629 RepID=UPI002A752057|nr:3-hydroxyacyl-CoA dehydrogenase NAD-binding domain-containing protein [Arcobacter sp.]MDY3204596.1 3-hydroxyacyl-CoA dehydrogenase NAD-binding domain-containing protein [Arcobacter sp.]